NYKDLTITTLREQIELSTKGQEHAELLDSVLALWLDSHVLVSNQTMQPSIDNASDDSEKPHSLWQALEHDLTDLFTYQTAQNEHVNTEGSPLVENAHSLCLFAKQSDVNTKPIVSELPDSLTDTVLPLSQLITAPNLALWQQ